MHTLRHYERSKNPFTYILHGERKPGSSFDAPLYSKEFLLGKKKKKKKDSSLAQCIGHVRACSRSWGASPDQPATEAWWCCGWVEGSRVGLCLFVISTGPKNPSSFQSSLRTALILHGFWALSFFQMNPLVVWKTSGFFDFLRVFSCAGMMGIS